MRDDLEFLYTKAMKSTSYRFMNEVFGLLIDSEWYREADLLTERILHMTYRTPQGRFRFIMENAR